MLDTGATRTYIDADWAHNNLSSIEQIEGSQSATMESLLILNSGLWL